MNGLFIENIDFSHKKKYFLFKLIKSIHWPNESFFFIIGKVS